MSIEVALPRPTRFSMGRALGESIVVFARNLFWLVPAACVARAVVLLAPEPPGDGGSMAWSDLAVDKLTDWLASSLADAAIILVILQILRSHRTSIRHLTAGFHFVVPLMAAYAIVNLPWTVLAIVDQLWESEGIESFARWFLCYVIATVFYVRWSISTQAIVIDRVGPLAGLVRSARLTKDRRWAVFGVTIIPSIAFILLNVIMGFVSELVAMKEWVTDAIGYLIAATSTAYFAVLTTVLYSDLRREKEGADSGELARVFD
jgi:hypothetical protein